MSALRWKYPLTSLMKLSALDLSLLKIWGRLPIAFTSAATCTGCWAACGCPPPLGCPGPLPPGGPDPFPLCRSTFCIMAAILCCAIGAAPKWDVVVADVVAVLVVVAVIIVGLLGDRLIVLISGLLHSVGSIGVCLICWSTVGSPLPSLSVSS